MHWTKRLIDYIEDTPEDKLTPQSAGTFLGLSPQILSQEVLYTYQYSFMELVEYIKEGKKEPKRHLYTPLEHYLYGNRRPRFHQPMNTWVMSFDFNVTELEDMTISGVKVPYEKINDMERKGFPGQRKDESTFFLDPPDGINYVGAWILEDDQTGEMSYFYGSTGKDQEDRRSILQKYRTDFHIPGGKYAWTQYESDYRIYGNSKLYGGLIIRRAAAGDISNHYKYDNSRFIFEMYNDRNELSIYFPVIEPDSGIKL